MSIRRFVPIVVSAGILAACSSGGGSSSNINIDDLTESGTECPVQLAGAASNTGHEGAFPSGEVETAGPDSVLTKAKAVAVDCTLDLPGGDQLHLLVAASHLAHAAVSLLLPTLQRDAQLETAQLAGVVSSAAKTKAGDLAHVPGTEPVALAVVDVGGAKSAAFELSADKLGRQDVEAIALQLADDFG